MSIHLCECPRDAMQGVEPFIPTENKIRYLQHLLGVGFDTLDFGSFVSPKAIPQMRDTAEVLRGLDLSETRTALLAIVANERGAEDASSFDEIRYLGYPFSISETFQKRNTNASIDQSLSRVEEIQQRCVKSGKEAMIYISMAFGNPYGDPWSADLAAHWINRLHSDLDVNIISLADTVGVSDVPRIESMFGTLIPSFPNVRIGAHLHSTPGATAEKLQAAYANGCRHFDSAINGLGGCPMAEDELVGNVATEVLLQTLPESELQHINLKKFFEAVGIAGETFPS